MCKYFMFEIIIFLIRSIFDKSMNCMRKGIEREREREKEIKRERVVRKKEREKG